METNEAVEIGESWSGDRVLDDDTRARIKSAIRGLLTLKEPEDDLEELTEDLPLEVKQLNISYSPEFILIGDLAFTNFFCYDGMLIFESMCPVNYPARKMYQDGAFELGRKVGIPIEPPSQEILRDT